MDFVQCDKMFMFALQLQPGSCGPISEAKQGRAWLVLGWETAWEYQVL